MFFSGRVARNYWTHSECDFLFALVLFLRGSLALHQLREGFQRGLPRRVVSLRDLVQPTLQLLGSMRRHRLRWVQQGNARDVVLTVRSLLGMPVGARDFLIIDSCFFLLDRLDSSSFSM